MCDAECRHVFDQLPPPGMPRVDIEAQRTIPTLIVQIISLICYSAQYKYAGYCTNLMLQLGSGYLSNNLRVAWITKDFPTPGPP